MTDYAIDRTKWSQMNIFEQMGNIYSEVGRSFNAKRQGQTERKDQATTRAIDLFDATIEDLTNKKSVRSKEVLTAKSEFLSNINSEKFNEKETASLEKYFLEFAIAARRFR
ncbi:MAG TPA: hypothetical protein VNE40_02700 [Candidatus Dormibacteraeota bacterium]|nr:hypothetical protein [Candidatus Dormibacteraeota bacterium]